MASDQGSVSKDDHILLRLLLQSGVSYPSVRGHQTVALSLISVIDDWEAASVGAECHSLQTCTCVEEQEI